MKEYELKNRVAPPELREIWPTGMSPVLQIFSEGKQTKTVAESGHIVLYLIKYYDFDNNLKFESDDDSDWVDYYLHFAEGSLQSYGVGMIVGEVVARSIPWPLNVPLNLLFAKINALFYAKRLYTNYQFLDSQLEKKGGGFSVGDHISGADIMLDYPVNSNLFKGKLQAENVTPGKDPREVFPNLYKWHQLIMSQPLRKEAEAKIKEGR